MNNSLKNNILHLLQEFPNQTIGIAVSGGQDSLYLLHNLKQLTSHIIVLHINHNTRKDNADEVQFIQKICTKWHIPYAILENKTPLSLHESNFENSARTIRYQLLEDFAQKNNIPIILTAHHLNDLIETIFLKILRGSLNLYIPSRRAISENSSIQLVRPILDISKKEITNYIDKHQIPYKDDFTNKDPSYLRNFLRLNIFPLLYKKIQHLENKLKSLSKLSWQEQNFLQKYSQERFEKIFINNQCDSDLFLKEDIVIQARIIRIACLKYSQKKISHKEINNILHLIQNKSLHSQNIYHYNNFKIIKEQKKIIFIFEKSYKNLEKNAIILHNNILYNNFDRLIIKNQIGTGVSYRIDDCISIRYFQAGDKIAWDNGHKKIANILKDKKIPLSQRKNTLILQKNNQIIGVLVNQFVYISKKHRANQNQQGLYFKMKGEL